MRVRLKILVAFFLLMLSHSAFATGAEPAKDVQVDTSACTTAAAAGDDDKTISACGELIGNEKTAKADRIKALIARAAAFDRKDNASQAIEDYDTVMQLDPNSADTLNARGEIRRKNGSFPKALADFGMAIKLKPDYAIARANYKSLALEIERIGALIAVAGKPSFYCKTARRAVEKVICANRELADLDRGIHSMNVRIMGDARSFDDARKLQREQEAFLARRNAEFGRPGYDLRQAMKDRLRELVGADGY